MTEQTTSLIVLDTNIVSTTKADQAVWVLSTAAAELDAITDRYAFLDVVDADTKVQAEKAIMDIRSKRKAWDANRKEWGQPLDLAKKTMDRAMREHIENPAEAIEAGLIAKVGAYVRAQEEARQAEMARARKAAEEAQAKLDAERRAAEEAARKEAEAKGVEFVPPPAVGIPEVVVAAPPPIETPQAEGISYRRVWKYEVEDATKVPDAYTKRVIDEEAVTAAIKAATFIPAGGKLSQCNAAIPGIRIYYEDRPVVGGR
jgi:hypothetical protein